MAAVALGATISCYPAIAGGEILRYQFAWLPQFGLNFSLRMDGFAWIFTVLILSIGLLVILYARYYMSDEDPIPRSSRSSGLHGRDAGHRFIRQHHPSVGVLGTHQHLFLLLISYWHGNANARDGARMALTITGIGGFCLLIGFLLLGNIVGSYDLDKVLASGDMIRVHPLYLRCWSSSCWER